MLSVKSLWAVPLLVATAALFAFVVSWLKHLPAIPGVVSAAIVGAFASLTYVLPAMAFLKGMRLIVWKP